MRKRTLFSISILSVNLFFPSSWAQVDTTAILLGNSTPEKPEEGVQSGRYQLKKPSKGEPLIKDRATSKGEALSKDKVPSNSEPVAEATKSKKRSRKTASELGQDTQTLLEQTNSPKPESLHPSPPEAPAITPTYAEQIKDLVLGRTQPMEAYKEQVHPDDVRRNKIEINFSPGILYYDSKANYSYRNYRSFSPVAFIGAEIWWTPFIGLYGQYGFTTGADIVENGAINSRSPATHETIESGLDFRSFFGMSRKSNSMSFGFHYLENKFLVPSDNLFRSRTKSSGIGVHFQARFPTAPSYSWTLGAKMEPRLAHAEYGTALALQSGASPESSRMALFLGGEFKLSREHQMIWNLSAAIEKNQFLGPANLVDPETSNTPQGISVTQTTTMLTLGYRWGH